MICWAESWDIYKSECYDKVNPANKDQEWILINEFDKNYTNAMIAQI